MNNAQVTAVPVLYRPTDPTYDEAPRRFQGCPTIAVTKGGRIYLGWYAGGDREPHMENYNLLICSDDKGETWSSPLLVIPSSKELCIHALDIQLWISPVGILYVFWVQNHTYPDDGGEKHAEKGQPLAWNNGWVFPDFDHNAWYVTCDNPDDADPVFSEPRRMDNGFLRCKPLVTDTGRILLFNYDQTAGKGLERYGYSVSDDDMKTTVHHYGAEKLATYFDEAMAYQKKDGTIRMLARTWLGELGEAVSCDDGDTWSEAYPSGITAADTRFFISRTPRGRVLLIVNDNAKSRTDMTLCLSEDDGETWAYKKCIDTRADISYPDADFLGDEIVLTYDRERTGAKEINFVRIKEEDIMNPETEITVRCISKPEH